MGMERDIVRVIREQGPLTGSELLETIHADMFLVWRHCMLSRDLSIQTIGPRYLRLDRRIEGFARLSPSILREFLTYSVIGLAEDPDATFQRGGEIRLHIEQVTRSKSELAYGIFSAVADRLENRDLLGRHACIMIAGDVVYNMAHDVPRPERSTHKLVRGSDMDIVVVVDDLFPKDVMEELDAMIYAEKQSLLMTPHLREEIDYVVKDMARVREQIRFDTFKHMVACKILDEGALLYGSEDLFCTIKELLRGKGITQRLNTLENQARLFRREAEEYLLSADPQKIREEYQYLFYPAEESEEFE